MHPPRIGCSGYAYKEWKGIFYPEGLAQKNWFAFYASHFNTLELNASFYKIPTERSLQKWYAESPPQFLFSVKANRLFTHFRKMENCAAELSDFYNLLQQNLKEKLGCILFQFPPTFSFTEQRLQNILTLTNKGFANAIEFRHASWYTAQVYQALAENHLIFVSHSHPCGLPEDVVITHPVAYYRFHGKPVLFKSRYDVDALEKIALQISKADQAFIYFNNTWGESALHNASEMQQLFSSISSGSLPLVAS